MPGLGAFSVAAVKIGRVYGVVVGVIRRISRADIGLEGVQICCSVGVDGDLLELGVVDAVRAATKGRRSVVVSGARAGAEMMCMGMGMGVGAGVRSSVRVVVESNNRAGAPDSVLSKAAMVHVGGNRRGRGRGLVACPITFPFVSWLGEGSYHAVAWLLRSCAVSLFSVVSGTLGVQGSRNRGSGVRKSEPSRRGSPGTVAVVVPTQRLSAGRGAGQL